MKQLPISFGLFEVKKVFRLGLVFSFVIQSDFVFTQDSGAGAQYAAPKIEDLVKIPNSPEAQAFAKYGKTPVNLYTGSPDISLPIHTLQGRELSLSISLSYDASGLKVEQIATSAGLGWNLNVGGMVTRNVRGLPDDYLSSTPAYIPFYEPVTNIEYEFVKNFTAFEGQRYQPGLLGRYFTFLQLAIKNGFENHYELQPDTYSFSVNGLSGTLVIDYQHNSAYCIEHPDIKVVPIFSVVSTFVKVIESWMISDRDGNSYFFAAPETTTVDEHNSYDGARVYYSAWALTTVVSKSKKDQFEFHWSDHSWNQPKLAGRADYRVDVAGHNTPCGTDQMIQPQTSPTYSINQKELQEIWMNGKKAIVVTGKPRNDLSGKQAIDNVFVFDQDERQLSRFRLVHSYFGQPGVANENELRLRLDALEVYGDNATPTPLTYKFLYYGSESYFPSRESFSQDFWGFFNAAGNSTLIPYEREFDETNIRYLGWRGADRIPKSEHAQTGTIRTIVYPTSGSTEFEYEGHRVTEQIANFESHTEIVARVQVGLVGGTTEDNPFNYCDDIIAKPPYPRGTDVSFTVPAPGMHYVHFLANGVQGGNTTMQYAALYKSETGEARHFCDLYRAENLFQYYSPAPDGSSVIRPIFLDSGTYRILLMNNNPNLTIQLQVLGRETINEVGDPFKVGGLRIKRIIDKDELGQVVLTRAFYYGDLSKIPISSISQSFILSGNLNSGTLHHNPQFMSSRKKRVFEQAGQITLEHDCYSTIRTSNSSMISDLHVTYPVVTEIQFGSTNDFNGFIVFEFSNTYPDSYKDGFSKTTILNGRILKKRVFDGLGQLINQEEHFYSQRSAGIGVGGYYFKQLAEVGREDLYIKSAVNQPGQEFFEYQPMGHSSLGQGDPQEQHCYLNGNIVANFHCIYMGMLNGSATWDCTNAQASVEQFKQHHPGAIETWESSPLGFSPPWYRVKLTAPHHVIINCRFLDGEWQKVPYSFPRYWATTDSTRITQYHNGARHQVVTRTFYDNFSHFQPTRSISRDSKGVVRTMRFSYPHDMQTTEPQTPAWNSLIAAHRISEQVQVESTFGSGQPDFRQQVQYKSVHVNNEQVFMPDVTFLASGSSPLEPRIRVHKYDGKGNVLEVSRENDTRTVYLWGYNAQYPIAVIQNANAEEVFFSSFEEEDRSSVVGDAFCGQYSRINGFVKELSNLIPGKPYNLSFWRKVGSSWQFSSQEVVPVNNNFLINLSGQIDDVRFLPQNAQMVTYTYKPGIGITSTCDANGVPTFYDYDPLNRLWLVRDRFKNILKENTYHYKK